MIRSMKGVLASVVLAVSACGAGDDTIVGTRDQCAAGGVLTDCPDADRDAKSACWRLVDCGVIVVENADDNGPDWGRCVDGIESQPVEYQRLVINCIAASTCDQLFAGDPENPGAVQYCGALGDN